MAGDRDIVKQLQRRLGNWDPDAAVRYYWTGQWHKQCEYNEQGEVIQLYLCKLTLVQIPSEVWLFPALQFLYLSDNQLSTLPAEIGQLAALQFLDLDNNHLSTLPAEIGRLSALRKLNLAINQLSTLPAEIGQLSALRVLYLSDNPLQIPPPEIIAQPTPAILAYLRTMQPIKIFYCYAHEDKDLRDRIDKHLGVLTRLGRIVGWYDREIQAGTEWEREIEGNLNTANIILLLVSADFVASDYCYGVEMQKALEMHEKGRARVLPILLRPVDWRGAPFAKLQLLGGVRSRQGCCIFVLYGTRPGSSRRHDPWGHSEGDSSIPACYESSQ